MGLEDGDRAKVHEAFAKHSRSASNGKLDFFEFNRVLKDIKGILNLDYELDVSGLRALFDKYEILGLISIDDLFKIIERLQQANGAHGAHERNTAEADVPESQGTALANVPVRRRSNLKRMRQNDIQSVPSSPAAVSPVVHRKMFDGAPREPPRVLDDERQPASAVPKRMALVRRASQRMANWLGEAMGVTANPYQRREPREAYVPVRNTDGDDEDVEAQNDAGSEEEDEIELVSLEHLGAARQDSNESEYSSDEYSASEEDDENSSGEGDVGATVVPQGEAQAASSTLDTAIGLTGGDAQESAELIRSQERMLEDISRRRQERETNEAARASRTEAAPPPYTDALPEYRDVDPIPPASLAHPAVRRLNPTVHDPTAPQSPLLGPRATQPLGAREGRRSSRRLARGLSRRRSTRYHKHGSTAWLRQGSVMNRRHEEERAQRFVRHESVTRLAPNGAVKLRRMESGILAQLEDMPEWKPWFLGVMTLVQTIMLIVLLAKGGFAPIKFKAQEESKVFERFPGSPASEFTASRTLQGNVMMGPPIATLINYGAKYAGCLKDTYEDAQAQLSSSEFNIAAQDGIVYGACLDSSDNSTVQCGYTEAPCTLNCNGKSQVALRCPTGFLFYQDQQCAELSPAVTGDNVVVRPCSFLTSTLEVECQRTSKKECDWRRGTWSTSFEKCEQVSIIGAVCGVADHPAHKKSPKQHWRLFTPVFLHNGFVSFVIMMVFQWTLGRNIEKVAGPVRMALIYMIASVGGVILSAVLQPDMITTGAAGAVCALVCLGLVELIQLWPIVESPWLELLKQITFILLFLCLGTLPYLDNFMHLGGALCGLLAGFTFLPYINFGKSSGCRKLAIICISFPVLVLCYAAGLAIFYGIETTVDICPNCDYINCIPWTEGLCTHTTKTIVG